MVNREKVIKALEKCKRCECDDCTEKGASHAPWDCPAYDAFVENAITLLKELPDITRCKYCKYSEECIPSCEDRYCVMYDQRHDGDWFCADGKRRETND